MNYTVCAENIIHYYYINIMFYDEITHLFQTLFSD